MVVVEVIVYECFELCVWERNIYSYLLLMLEKLLLVVMLDCVNRLVMSIFMILVKVCIVKIFIGLLICMVIFNFVVKLEIVVEIRLMRVVV